MNKNQKSDPSGRGNSEGYIVPFPGKMSPFTQEEIDAVSDVMKNANSLSQSKYLLAFEEDFKKLLRRTACIRRQQRNKRFDACCGIVQVRERRRGYRAGIHFLFHGYSHGLPGRENRVGGYG